MASVFLSYRREPSAMLAQLVSKELRARGIDVYLDVRQLDGGGPFPKRLLEAIAASDVFVCLVADTTFESDFVRREIDHAHMLGKPMIPVFQESFKSLTEYPTTTIEALLNFDGVHIFDRRNVLVDESISQLATVVKKTVLPKRAKPIPSRPVLAVLGLIVLAAALFLLTRLASPYVPPGTTGTPPASTQVAGSGGVPEETAVVVPPPPATWTPFPTATQEPPTNAPPPTRTDLPTWTPSPTDTPEPPTATPPPTQTDLPTSTPSPTDTPTPSRTPTPTVSAGVINTLAALGISTQNLNLAFWMSEKRVEIPADVNDLLQPALLDGVNYDDFVMGATVAWGPGATEDQCGFMIRRADSENFYHLEIDRIAQLRFRELKNNRWDPPNYYYGDGGLIHTQATETNELVIVASDDTFTFFVNRQYAGQASDDTITRGLVGVTATTFKQSAETYCTFRDIWLLPLTEPLPTFPTPTITPTSMATPMPTLPPDVSGALQQMGLSPANHRLDYYVNEQLIKIEAVEENIVKNNLRRWRTFNDSRYQNFIVSSTIVWGPGAAEDSCGFVFRVQDGENKYAVHINRLGEFWVNKYSGNSASMIYQGGSSLVRTDANAVNTLTLVAVENTFTLYLNGNISNPFQDDTFPEGRVGLFIWTRDESALTNCTFRNTWLVPLGDEIPVFLTPISPMTPGLILPSATPAPVIGMIVNNERINVRSSPQELADQSNIVGGLEPGQRVQIFERRPGWVRISLRRWVASRFVRTLGTATPRPPSPPGP